jgi:hypothetical protein
MHAVKLGTIHDDSWSEVLITPENIHASTLEAFECEGRQRGFWRKTLEPAPVDFNFLACHVNVMLAGLQELEPLALVEVGRLLQFELLEHVMSDSFKLLILIVTESVPAIEYFPTNEVSFIAR